MSTKERMEIPRVRMPIQKPEDRIKNFSEVPLGLDIKDAMQEAERCLDCKKPLCVTGCPVGIDIPGFIQKIAEGDFEGSARVMRESNFLPGITGRVCPQDKQCEAVCIVGKKHEPVAIGYLERFIADYERKNKFSRQPYIEDNTGKKVAIIGSGPAGLTAAYDLRVKGHRVVVFEAFHRGGGVMVYGIPRFRLPIEIIDEDLALLEQIGVEFAYDMIIGKILSVDDLLQKEGFDAVFIASGAGLPKMLGIPGENLNGIYSANEYLTRVNLMGANEFPKNATPLFQGNKVTVIGAGNTAMDVMRTAKRLGANVTCVYRRSRAEAPARTEELEHAEEEFINFMWLTNPVEFIGDENNYVKQMRCAKMVLSEPDSSGRRKPIPSGEEIVLDTDTVVFSLGCDVNSLIADEDEEITTNKWGVIMVDRKTYHTAKKGVFAGGDSVTGGATVILAMGQGKDAAAKIHEYLMGNFPYELDVPTDPNASGIQWEGKFVTAKR